MNKFVFEYISERYQIIDNDLYEKISGKIILPETLETKILNVFGFNNDLTYLIVFNWLVLNGMTDIRKHWDIYNEKSINTLIKKYL